MTAVAGRAPAPEALAVLRGWRALVERFPERYPALLESTAFHAVTGRRSFLFAFPGEALEAREGSTSFLVDLDRAYASPARTGAGALGFGHLVYLGYEMLTQIEAVAVPAPPPSMPLAVALPVAAALVVDHATGRTELRCGGGDEAALRERIDADLKACGRADDVAAANMLDTLAIEEDEPAAFLDAVRSAKAHIAAGDIFQANLSREWRVRLADAVGPVALYRSLSAANPAPFAGIFRYGDAAVVSSSPERLLCGDGRRFSSRPIAGTRPRTGADAARIGELLGSEKERAEHVMLVDLIRNDLGKFARFGSVAVDELMTVETYEHVHHIVSEVRCDASPGTTPGRAIAALFPGGTITGCPKVRSMEIIADLERAGRGAYTGSLGYVAADGAMDLNILIRTMVWRPGEARFRTGAGIVADSDPETELEETRAKALGLLRAFDAAAIARAAG